MCMREPVMELIEKHNSTSRVLRFYPEKNFGKYYKIQIRFMPTYKQVKEEEIKKLCEEVWRTSKSVAVLSDTYFAENGIMELSISTMARNYSESLIVNALKVIQEYFSND